ncbi:MAG: anti-sigma factor [Rhizobiaceae bacterium]
MSEASTYEPDGGGDEIVAAEYVVGTLPADERLEVSARIDADPHFARVVDRWEGHFAPMQAVYDPVEPPASVKPSIDRRLFSERAGAAAAPAVARPGMWASLAFWRGLTVAALAALVLFAALPFISPPTDVPQVRLVASLAAEGSDVHYLAVYDAATGEMALSHVSGARADGRDFELWMIEGSNAPVSMGVIPVGATNHMILPEASRAKLGAGIVLAVSLEPAGGSATGKPTGPVVAAGDLKTI